MDKCLKFLGLKICEKFETSYQNFLKFFIDIFGTRNFLDLKIFKHLLIYMPKCIELNTKSKPKLISFWVLGLGPRAQEINLSLDLEFYSIHFGI